MEREPLDGLIPFATSYELFERSAALYGDRPAILAVEPGSDASDGLTYAELLAAITAAANQYQAGGVGPGDTVAVILPNFVETHVAIWAAEAIGRVCLINAFLEPAHMAAILTATDARLVVCEDAGDGRISGRVAKAIAALDRPVGVMTVRTRFGAWAGKTRTVPDASAPPPGGVACPLTLETANVPPRFEPVRNPDAVASFLHTGGTTGAPKVAARSHRACMSQAWTVSAVMGLSDADVMLCGLPLFHTNGVTVTGLSPFSRGATVLLAGVDGYRDPAVVAGFWALARAHGVTCFSGVPTIYSRLLETFDGAIPSLRFGICGAAPMSVDLFRTFERETGVRILEGYGLTEGGCVSTLNPLEGEARIGSIGLRLPYQSLLIVRPDEPGVAPCEPGEIGVLAIKGPNVFEGYLKDEQTREVLRDGWLLTGDLARMDAEGYVWLTGRAKDLIIRGGHNIDPSIGEAALAAHPAVALAAVIGAPHADLGEIPAAFVTLRPGGVATADDLRAFARAEASDKAAAPAEVHVLDEMPVTPVGKIYKPALRRIATQDAIDRLIGEGRATVSLDERGDLVCVLQAAEDAGGVNRLAPYLKLVTPG